MLHTVAEISKLIGLSKVSIYIRLKLKEMEPYIIKKQGVTYIDEEGFSLIKQDKHYKKIMTPDRITIGKKG